MKAIIVVILIFLLLSSAAAAGGSAGTEAWRLYHPNGVLADSWIAYKSKFISSDGRVIDPMIAQGTTSEGQAYAMLRAVWSKDQTLFDRTWTWTQHNLSTGPGKLFGWKWGQREDKSWGLLSTDSATDADQDIALALILASKQFKNNAYLSQAKSLISNIWGVAVLERKERAYLLPGNWARSQKSPKMNLSYMAPYIYREFALIDPTHNWNFLVDSSYDLLNQAISQSQVGLPPDWCQLDPLQGKVIVDRSSKESDYSYDAMRVPWRIALDWSWNKDPRARALLQRMSFLVDSWKTNQKIYSTYQFDGIARNKDEPLCMLGCALPMFKILAPDAGKDILQQKLMSQYHDGLWRPDDNYYNQNWVWFGIAAADAVTTSPQQLAAGGGKSQ
jgi:endoglucanase